MEAKLLTLDIESFSKKVLEAQGIVQSLRNDKDLVLKKMESMAVLTKTDRMDEAADLIESIASSIKVYKELKMQVNQLQKDFEDIGVSLNDACLKEMIKDKYETALFRFKKKPSKTVGIDNEEEVEKRYRLVPKKIPPWTKWKVDKNKVKRVLIEDGTVKGCYLHKEFKLKILRK